MTILTDPRRARAVAAWSPILTNEIIFIHAGELIPRPGMQDQCFSYHSHPHFRWLDGPSERGAVLVFDSKQGWTAFYPTIGPLDTVWEGRVQREGGKPLTELSAWLAAQTGRPVVHLGAGYDSTDSPFEQKLLEARRPKDAAELALLRTAAQATAAGFTAARGLIAEGLTERQLQIELEAAMFRAGATGMGYDTIVGFGPTSAIFHADPGQRRLVAGEQVLIDAGAEVDGYVIDVTRTYPGPGGFTPAQAELYAVLEGVEQAACAACRPGVEWHDIHRLAARGIAQGLRELGYLRCGSDEALETEAIALFFPHGVGHLLGLGVRDASGVGPGRGAKGRCCGVTPRCDLALEPGFVVTVEPGIYLIPTLLDDPANRAKFATQVNWARLDKGYQAGGFRIEDDILVTDGEPTNLTVEIAR